MFWYVMIDCNKIQQYVFSSSRLKGICNASHLLSSIEKSLVPSLIENSRGNLIRSNGGILLAQFEDEKTASDFMSKASAQYHSIGIQTTCLIKELPGAQDKPFL